VHYGQNKIIVTFNGITSILVAWKEEEVEEYP
jgi:hypothetical protein